MNVLKSNFKYKGDRDYVHGTDIYNFAEQELKNISSSWNRFNISFLKRTIGNIDFFLGSKDDFQHFKEKEKATFRGIATSEYGELFFWGLENGTNVISSYEYDEKSVEQKSIYTDGEVEYDFSLSTLSPIEKFIPMFKLLLAKKCPEYKGKWMFTRLDLNQLLYQNEYKKVKMKIYQYANPKLVCADILNGEEKIGRIFFSLT